MEDQRLPALQLPFTRMWFPLFPHQPLRLTENSGQLPVPNSVQLFSVPFAEQQLPWLSHFSCLLRARSALPQFSLLILSKGKFPNPFKFKDLLQIINVFIAFLIVVST